MYCLQLSQQEQRQTKRPQFPVELELTLSVKQNKNPLKQNNLPKKSPPENGISRNSM